MGRGIMGRKLHATIALVAVLSWSKTSTMLCNAWVSTASSSSSSGSSGTSTFSNLNNGAATTPSLSSMKISTFDKRYWMILNAVVDDGSSRSGRNTTMTYGTTTTTTSMKKPQSKIKKTNKIFVDRWNTMFERLKEYKKIHGNTKVQKKYNDGRTPSLGNWVCKQRFEALVYQKTNGEEGQITPERIAKLESIGFVWELARQDEWEEKWLTMFSELEAFQKKYLSTKVPILNNKCLKDGSSSQECSMSSLGRWVKTQRKQRNRLLRNQPAPAMTKERLEMLESIDFEWKGKRVTDYDKWLNMYFKLLSYYQQHNTTIVSDSDGQVSSRLLNWTEEQRKLYRELNIDEEGAIQLSGEMEDNSDMTSGNTLTQHRIELLNEIFFDWSYCHKDKTWDDMFNELVEYKENFNSTLISTSINKRLGEWTNSQREKYKIGAADLDYGQIVKLDKIGFDWNATEDVNWNAMLDRLDAYKRKHDTTIVPNHDGGDRPLANWVGNQRFKLGKYVLNEEGEYYDDHDLVERIAFDVNWSEECEDKSKGFIKKLSPSTKATRIRRLNEIGFVWDAQEASWQDMYQRLLVFKEDNNGSTSVPFTSQEGNKGNSNEQPSESLGVWVRAQRQQRGELSEKRLQLLNEIGFEWDPLEAQWTEMFDRLCVYQKQNDGSTNVPGSYSPDPELGFWVNTQRRSYKRKTLPAERIDRLNLIGFVWEILS